MAILPWLLRQHPFFLALREHVAGVLRCRGVLSLDELVVATRRPVRSVLLTLDDMERSGEVQKTTGGISTADPAQSLPCIPSPHRIWSEETISGKTQRCYMEAVVDRESPALLWGQRRLLPDSAIERALYMVANMDRPAGEIVFLGDDDLVSPLVAAAAPGWDVHVVDIDQEVLNQAQRIARELGARLSVEHADLAQLRGQEVRRFDLAACDPFPSGDGSFELMFWRTAATMLRPDGLLVTTVAPSHKPPAYALGALRQLDHLGFLVTDLQAHYGRYEVFGFEFLPYENTILQRLRLQSRVSHTKSLLAARREKVGQVGKACCEPTFDFDAWTRAARRHYLTVQAGKEEQERIASQRGASPAESAPTAPNNSHSEGHNGLQVELLLPREMRDTAEMLRGEPKEEQVHGWASLLSRLGITAEFEECKEIVRLTRTPEIHQDGELAVLGLAIRALESWERWRFDD